MDEAELARRAVRRHLITEEQLREAESYAGEGRSLVAVLLDLGILRAEDLVKLDEPSRPAPAPSAFNRKAVIFLILLGGVIGFAIGSSTRPRPTSQATRTVYVPRPEIVDRMGERGKDLVRTAETIEAPEAEKLLQRALILLEESIPNPARGPLDHRLALARTRELLKRWEEARTTYLLIGEQADALRGAARCSLALQYWDEALVQANRACREDSNAESNLLRGRALIGLGRPEEARVSLMIARKLDPRLADTIDALLKP